MLGQEKRADHPLARADGFHQSDFGAPLEHGGRRSRADGQRRGDQSGEGHEPHQRADARQDAAFAFGHAANHTRFRSGKRLLNLQRDRRNVGAAIPAVIIFRRHLRGIAPAEIVFGLGERADVEPAVDARLAGKLLDEGERRDDGVVLGPASGE